MQALTDSYASSSHGTGAAIALSAAFLGTLEPLVEAEIVEQGPRRRNLGERDILIVEDETKLVTHVGGHQLPR
jgi:hypothetical protein